MCRMDLAPNREPPPDKVEKIMASRQLGVLRPLGSAYHVRRLWGHGGAYRVKKHGAAGASLGKVRRWFDGGRADRTLRARASGIGKNIPPFPDAAKFPQHRPVILGTDSPDLTGNRLPRARRPLREAATTTRRRIDGNDAAIGGDQIAPEMNHEVRDERCKAESGIRH
ncbi:hypothetical protein GCM10009628_26490 [Paeniglutamicibacter kerguelensis]